MIWNKITPTPIAELSYIKKATEILERPGDLLVQTGSNTLLMCYCGEWSWGNSIMPDIYDLDRDMFHLPEWRNSITIENSWPGKLARIMGADLYISKNENSVLESVNDYSSIKMVIEKPMNVSVLPNADTFYWSEDEYQKIALHIQWAEGSSKGELDGKIGHWFWASYIAKNTGWKLL